MTPIRGGILGGRLEIAATLARYRQHVDMRLTADRGDGNLTSDKHHHQELDLGELASADAIGRQRLRADAGNGQQLAGRKPAQFYR